MLLRKTGEDLLMEDSDVLEVSGQGGLAHLLTLPLTALLSFLSDYNERGEGGKQDLP